ncbi:MAG: sigma-70 family RNA polymerase sigma factor [Fimbriimonadaceae bacterium]|nr:sigma-70 family RNA polymerase sigma factor [Fimbriimonadaceae bacterium]
MTPTQAQRPDPAAFESYMRASHRQVYGLALRLTGQSSDAEDLVQEAYIRAYRFFFRYDPGLPFTSWMYRILTNIHIDHNRRKSRIRASSLDNAGLDGETVWEVADESAGPDKLVLEGELDDALQLGLLSMCSEFRLAVVLADVEGMAYEEIAEIMQTSIGTVRSRIHRGRKQLRRYLDREYPGRFCEVNV